MCHSHTLHFPLIPFSCRELIEMIAKFEEDHFSGSAVSLMTLDGIIDVNIAWYMYKSFWCAT